MSKFPIVPSVELQQANSSEYEDQITAPTSLAEDETGEIAATNQHSNSSTVERAADDTSVAEINWLYQELSKDLLTHVKGSSFLELLCLAYFLGAEQHLARHQGVESRSSSPMLQRLLGRLGYQAPFQEKLENCRRLLANNSLLRQFFHDGQHAISCNLAQEINLQSSLQQLVRQYAHYSLMDLNQFNASPYTQQQSQYRPLEIHAVKENSRVTTIIMAMLLFLLLSAGGSFLLLRIWFPEVLTSLLK